MAMLKAKEIEKMGEEERTKKMKELKMELVKSRVGAMKGGSSKVKTIKRIMARINTINHQKNGGLNKK